MCECVRRRLWTQECSGGVEERRVLLPYQGGMRRFVKDNAASVLCRKHTVLEYSMYYTILEYSMYMLVRDSAASALCSNWKVQHQHCAAI